MYDERRFSWTGGGEAGQAAALGTAGRAGRATATDEEAADEEASEGICGAEGEVKVSSVTTETGGGNV